MPELLSEARLRNSLAPRPFQFYEQAGSTNDLVREWAGEGAPTGAVVIAEEQLGGRGRFERRWIAPPGTALLFSVILRPRLLANRLPRVTMLGAVAVAECLAEIGLERVALKWPNDVQLAERKVAGILPEADWQNDQVVAVVLGIGLNIRIDFSGGALAEKAISVETALGKAVDRAALLNQLLRRIDYWSVHLNEPELLAAWRSRLDTLGKQVTVSAPGGSPISGQASDVDDDGALLLRAADGTLHRVIAGEVTLNMESNG